jgi:Spx/MgsR family transcriptional regulator
VIKLYGISNCDTVKKARKWLDDKGISYEFVDFRKKPLTAAQLKRWADTVGWESLINKRSRTWRELDKLTQNSLNKSNALKLMQEMPTLIKRPVMDTGDNFIIGFDSATYEELF